tara:strand:- start:114 stop:353 length:240 start_codon:yes stop_codon:yes gene_type:complete
LDFLVTQARKNKYVLDANMMCDGFDSCTINLISKTDAKAFAELSSEAYKNKFDKDCSVYFINLSEGTRLVKYKFTRVLS